MTMAAMTRCSEYSRTLLRPALRRCRVAYYPRRGLRIESGNAPAAQKMAFPSADA
jgi:hypothetical protein